MPAGFWTDLGDYSRIIDDWTGYSDDRWSNSLPSNFVGFDLYDCEFFQLPLVRGTAPDSSAPQHGDGLDTGFFYGVHDTTGAIDDMILYHTGGTPGDISTMKPWYFELNPPLAFGSLEPSKTSTYGDAKYVTGWVGRAAGGYNIIAYPHFYFWGTVTNVYTVWHYAPWAWYGRPPAVTADIAMTAGLAASMINQTAFDNAYDGTADPPWNWWAPNYSQTVLVSRRVGEKVIDTIIEVARHTRDYYFIDETGKLSTSSYTRPFTQAGLTLADGVISVEWDWTDRWLVNRVYASYGSAVKQWGTSTSRPDGPPAPGAVEEELLQSYMGTDFIHEAVDAASETMFGTRWLNGRNFTTNEYGTPRTVKRVHYPLALAPCNNPAYSIIPITDYWLTSDAKPRRMVSIVQNLLGMEYLLGDKVSGVAVTCDGETIDDTRCVEREIDYDELSVMSLLAEIPSN